MKKDFDTLWYIQNDILQVMQRLSDFATGFRSSQKDPQWETLVSAYLKMEDAKEEIQLVSESLLREEMQTRNAN